MERTAKIVGLKLSWMTAESLKFIVKDSGPGIPIEQRAKVMQALFTTKDVGKGTGLGLPLVSHNGHFKIVNPNITGFIIEFQKVCRRLVEKGNDPVAIVMLLI